MLLTSRNTSKTLLSLPLKITVHIRWVGEGKKILEKVTHEASKQAPKATAAGVQHTSSEDYTSSQGPAKAPSVQSGNSSTKQDSPQQMKGPQIKELKSVRDNPNVQCKMQQNSSSLSELDKIQRAMKDGSWVAVEQHTTSHNTTTTSTYSKPQGTTTSTSVSTNIPTPPPLPVSKPSTNPHPIGQPITNEVLQQQIGSLKKISFLIERGVEQGYLRYSDGPKNPKAGKIKLTPEGNLRYKEQTQEKSGVVIKKATTPIDLSDKELKTGTVFIGEQTEITRPDQEHLVVTSNDGKILIWGYLTSNGNNDTLEIAKGQIEDKTKPQYFKPFDQPMEISSDKFTEYEEGSRYLQDPQINDKLKATLEITCKNEPIPYNDTGLTKEDLEALTNKVVEEKESKPSTFYDDDKDKKKKKGEDYAKKNQENQKKESQEKKAKAKFDAENKPKATTHDD